MMRFMQKNSEKWRNVTSGTTPDQLCSQNFFLNHCLTAVLSLGVLNFG